MASGKTLQSTIELSGVLSPSLQKAMDKAAAELADLADETLESADAATRLVAEMDAQEDVLKTLKRAYAGYVASGEKSSEQAKDLEKRIKDVSEELRDNKKTLDAAEKAANSFGDSLDDAEKDAKDAGDGFTVLKGTISDLAADAIQSAVEGFKEMAVEGEATLALLEARTGANAEQMEEYEGIIRKIYQDNYGESLGDVGEKLSTVIQMTDDLDNASLEKVTKNVIGLEDVFGFGTTESLRAVNSLMDQFGITSDEAFNLIVQGARSGLNQNDDLLDVINEYAVQFEGAGFSADQMFNMLKNGADSGVWSVDKLGDAIKEYNIRMSDGTATDALMENYEALGMTEKEAKTLAKAYGVGGKAGSKAMKDTLDAILSVEDENKRYQLGVEMFGTMWEDLGEDAVKALLNTEGAIQSTNNAMEEMDTAAYDTLQGKLSGLWREHKVVASAAMGTVATLAGVILNWGTLVAKFASAKAVIIKLAPLISKALAGISGPIGWIILAVVAIVAAFVNLWKNSEEFRDKMIGIWEDMKSKFDEFGQGIVDRLNALGFDFEDFGEVVTTAFESIKKVAGGIWKGFCEYMGVVFQFWWQFISDIFSFVLDSITGIFDIFCGIFTGDWDLVWQGVKETFASAWDFIVNIFNNYVTALKNVTDVVLGWFGTSWEKVWGSISSFFVNTWNSIASFFSGIWTSITSFCSTAWETIKNVVQVGIMAIKSIISAAFQLITLPFRFIWENCKGIIISVWNAIKEKVAGAVTAIVNFVKQRWENLKNNVLTVFNAVKTIIANVWNAIKGVITPIVTAIVNFVKQCWENLKNNVLTVFNAVKTIATNVWNGIKTSISNVVNGIRNTVSTIFDSIKSKVSGVFNSIKSIASSVWNGIKSAITTPINAARDAVKAAIDRIKGFFNFNWSLPKLKLPHFSIKGEFSLSPPSVPKLSIDWYKDGGILTQPTIFGSAGNKLLAGGEAGAEAVLPLAVLWDKMESILRNVFNGSSTEGTSNEGLTAKAGKLLTLDDFSLGSLANNTDVVIYYDFSGFTWSPHIEANGSDDEDSLMARLKAHEAEFFDWLEEFIQAREAAQYA